MKKECPECEGSGVIDYLCNACNGSGEGRADGTRCCTCRGSGGGEGECEECKGEGKIEVDEEEEGEVNENWIYQ